MDDDYTEDDYPPHMFQWTEEDEEDTGLASGSDPNFVSNYFLTSRLAHLSKWRVKFQFLAANRRRGGPAPPRFEPGLGWIIHLDLDAFFVSVSTRNRPDLVGKPVAISHASAATSSATVASVNYVARQQAEIRNGTPLFVARQKCSDLVVLPYDFQAYDEVASQFYSVLFSLCPLSSVLLEAVSCDEVYLAYPPCPQAEIEAVVARLRQAVATATSITCSAGIGHNKVLARVATAMAKPNGQRVLTQVDFLTEWAAKPIDQLPGVGYTSLFKLLKEEIRTIADIRASSLPRLQALLDSKQGAQLIWDAAHGRDNRPFGEQGGRGQVSAKISWGVRFQEASHQQMFLEGLTRELEQRLRDARVRGARLRLELYKRKPGSISHHLKLGHGPCSFHVKSVDIASTYRADDLLLAASQLLASLEAEVPCRIVDVRGIGLTVSSLTDVGTGPQLRNLRVDQMFVQVNHVQQAEGGGEGEDSLSSSMEDALIQAVAPPAAAPRAAPPPSASQWDPSTLADIAQDNLQLAVQIVSEYPALAVQLAKANPELAEELRRAQVIPASPDDSDVEVVAAPILVGAAVFPSRIEDIDPTFVDALPLAVKRELERQFAQAIEERAVATAAAAAPPLPAESDEEPSPKKGKGKGKKRAQPPKAPMPAKRRRVEVSPPPLTSSEERQVAAEAAEVMVVPPPVNLLSFPTEDIGLALDAYLSTHSQPTPAVGELLLHLVIDAVVDDLQRTQVLLRCLNRLTAERGGVWRAFYENHLQPRVQPLIRSRYGGEVVVN